uniref:Endonuclease/exonuclease/phosphatase domain-containing protein n=1 Tax=Cannabis sativa TaxID=3483 RepID=A0A803QAL2_CANSA
MHPSNSFPSRSLASTQSFSISSPPTVTDLSQIYILDISLTASNFFATYPPQTPSNFTTTKSHTPVMDISSEKIFTTPSSLVSITSQTNTSAGFCHTSDKKNVKPNCSFKRQHDVLSIRKVLKRCRGTPNLATSSWSVEEGYEPNGSATLVDFDGSINSIAEQSPNVLFIVETKLSSNNVTRFKQSLNFYNGLEAPIVGLKGGLMLLWKDDVDVTLQHYGDTFFDYFMAVADGGLSFYFTGFYGAPDSQNKSAFWLLLKRFAEVTSQNPWLVIGDFNEILSNFNKSGGLLRNEDEINPKSHHLHTPSRIYLSLPLFTARGSGVTTTRSRWPSPKYGGPNRPHPKACNTWKPEWRWFPPFVRTPSKRTS